MPTRIRGTLLSTADNRTPISGVTVQAYDPATGFAQGTDVTDVRGEFTLSGLEDRTWVVRVVSGGSNSYIQQVKETWVEDDPHGQRSTLSAHGMNEIRGAALVGQGGTGLTSVATGNLLLGAGSSPMTTLAPGTSGNILRSDGTNWTSSTLIASGVVTGTGTVNALTKWTTTTGALGDSGISDDGFMLSSSREGSWTGPHIFTSNGSIIPITIRAAAVQSSMLLRVEDNLGSAMFAVGASGLIVAGQDRTPSDILTLGPVAAPASPGQADTHSIVLWAKADDGSPHDIRWTQFGDVTSNAGASAWTWKSSLDAGALTTRMSLGDNGLLTVTNRITGVSTPSGSTDAATKGYVDGLTTGGANPSASVGLAAVNGSAVTYLRSDGAPALDVGITPTWTNVHTFSSESVHNGGIDLGSSGRLDSQVASGNTAFLVKPTNAFTSGTLFEIQDSAAVTFFRAAWDRMSIGTTPTAGSGAAFCTFGIPASSTLSVVAGGNAAFIGAGTTISTLSGSASVAAMRFFCNDGTGATWTTGAGAAFICKPTIDRDKTLLIGGFFAVDHFNTAGARTMTDGCGWYVGPNASQANVTWTNWKGGWIRNPAKATNAYGLYIDEMNPSSGGTIENGIFLANATSAYKAIAIRDQNTWIGSSAAATLDLNATTVKCVADFDISAKNIVTDTTTGTKIGTGTTQKLGFFNATPVVRPAAYTPTNVTTDRAYDANATTLDEVADVLGTLIADLQSLGLIG